MHKSPAYNPADYTTGLIANVYRDKGPDCSLHGVSEKADTVLVVGPGVSGPFGEKSDRPTLYLHWWHNVPGSHDLPFLSPSPDPNAGYMSGGNFAYSCDSRFPSRQPIKIHDRME